MPAHQNPAGTFWNIFSYLLIIAFISFIQILQAPGLVLWTSPRVTCSSVIALWV